MRHFNIQLSLKDIQLNIYTSAINKLGLKYNFFSVYSDSDEIHNLPETGDYISLAGIKALKISRLSQNLITDSEVALNFKKSFFYKDVKYFDQAYYSNSNLPLLNNNAKYISLKDNLLNTFEEDKFIKPSSDLKGFIGGILERGRTVQDFLNNTTFQSSYMEETLLISDVQSIHSEYRFFVINNEVITGSMYKKNDKILVSNIIPRDVMICAHAYSKLYSPDKVFVMDLALLNNNTVKIIEYNCFNGSGCYDSDMLLVFDILKNIEI